MSMLVTPLVIRLRSQVPRLYWLTVFTLICFLWNLEGTSPWLVWHSVFWQDIKLCWKPCFSGAVPQNSLRGSLWHYDPQLGSNKTLFYSYYRLFIDYFYPQLSHSALTPEVLLQSLKLLSSPGHQLAPLHPVFSRRKTFSLHVCLFSKGGNIGVRGNETKGLPTRTPREDRAPWGPPCTGTGPVPHPSALACLGFSVLHPRSWRSLVHLAEWFLSLTASRPEGGRQEGH